MAKLTFEQVYTLADDLAAIEELDQHLRKAALDTSPAALARAVAGALGVEWDAVDDDAIGKSLVAPLIVELKRQRAALLARVQPFVELRE